MNRRQRPGTIASAAFPVALLLLGAAAHASALTLSVTPEDALFDEPVAILVGGVSPGQSVTFTLQTRDAGGVPWRSQATMQAGPRGTVDPARQAPVAGDYDSVDAMGLFWSMHRQDGKGEPFSNPALQRNGVEQPALYTLTAETADGETATASLRRRLMAPGVTMERIRRKDLFADLFVPAQADAAAAHAAVIVFGGAEGGVSGADAYARWLASHGFVALATAWYHAPGLNNDLVEVPVVQVASRALGELAGRAVVAADRIAMMGGSWGGTVAMAAASQLPEVRAVVSWVGSPVPFPGISRDPRTGAFRASEQAPFVIDGAAVPFAGFSVVKAFLDSGDDDAVRQALLPIWDIHGPLLLAAGSDDTLGVSGPMARLGLRALQAHDHGFDDRALVYEGAGHLIFPGYQPTAHRGDQLPGVPPVGGNADGYARADADIGGQTLKFLDAALDVSR